VTPVLLMLNRARLLRFVVGATASIAHTYDPVVNPAALSCWDRLKYNFARFVKFRVRDRVKTKIASLTGKPLVFFTNDDDPATLTQAIIYILSNEQRRWIKFVRVYVSRCVCGGGEGITCVRWWWWHCCCWCCVHWSSSLITLTLPFRPSFPSFCVCSLSFLFAWFPRYKDQEDVPQTVSPTYQQLSRCFPEVRVDYVVVIGEFGPSMVRHVSRELHVPATFMFMGTFNDDFPFTFTELGGLRLITN